MIKSIYRAPELDSVQLVPLGIMAESPNEVDSSISSLTSDDSDNNFFNF